MGARCGKITERKEQEEVDDESASNTNANGDIGIQTQVFPPPDINVTIVPDSIDAANGTDTSPGAKNTHNEDVERRDDMEAVVHQGASSAVANSNDISDVVAKPHAAKVLPHSVDEAIQIVLAGNEPQKAREIIAAILAIGTHPREDGELRNRAKRHPGGLALMQVLGVSSGGKVRNQGDILNLRETYEKLGEKEVDEDILHPYHHENDGLPHLPSLSSYKHTPAYSDYSGSIDFRKIQQDIGHGLPEALSGEEAEHEHVLVSTDAEKVWRTYESAKSHHSATSQHDDPHDLLEDKFVDHAFPPHPKSLYYNGKTRKHTGGAMAKLAIESHSGAEPELRWFRQESVLQRPDDLALSGEKPPKMEVAIENAIKYSKTEDWHVFGDVITPEDVSQGALGNCWFVGSLSSVLSVAPRLIKRLFRDERSRTGAINEYGAYVVRYCEGGRWVENVIDDLFPCAQIPTMEKGFLAFSGARGNKLFVPLLEKLLAKNRGCYEHIEGGRPGEGLRIFTGWPTMVLHLQYSTQTDHDINRALQLNAARSQQGLVRSDSILTDPEDYAKTIALRMDANCPFISDEYVWIRMRNAQEQGMICAAACGHSNQILEKCGGDQAKMRQHYREVGLSPSHCYAIMQTIECKDGLRLVQFRNPWGTGRTWNGAYGKHSSLWTKDLIEEIGAEKLQLEAQGMFWMNLDHVLQYFVSCAVSSWRHGWHEERFTVALPNTLEEPQPAFICSARDATDALLSLMQTEEKCLETLYVMDLGIVILNAKTRAFIGSTHRAALDTCIMEELIGVEEVIIIPLSFSIRGLEGMTPHSHEFTFGVFSAKPVITRPVQVDGTAVRDALVMHVKKYGKCTERSKDAFVYATEDGGFTYYIENHASDSSVVSVCALESFNNLYLSRDHSEQKAIRCDDIVPPNSGMLILVAAERPGGCQWSLASSVKQLGSIYPKEIHKPALMPVDNLHAPFLLSANPNISSEKVAWAQPADAKAPAPASWHPKKK